MAPPANDDPSVLVLRIMLPLSPFFVDSQARGGLRAAMGAVGVTREWHPVPPPPPPPPPPPQVVPSTSLAQLFSSVAGAISLISVWGMIFSAAEFAYLRWARRRGLLQPPQSSGDTGATAGGEGATVGSNAPAFPLPAGTVSALLSLRRKRSSVEAPVVSPRGPRGSGGPWSPSSATAAAAAFSLTGSGGEDGSGCEMVTNPLSAAAARMRGSVRPLGAAEAAAAAAADGAASEGWPEDDERPGRGSNEAADDAAAAVRFAPTALAVRRGLYPVTSSLHRPLGEDLS